MRDKKIINLVTLNIKAIKDYLKVDRTKSEWYGFTENNKERKT